MATDGSVGTVGNVQDFFGEISPAATTGDPLIADPYAKVATPVPTVPGPYTPPTAPSKTCTAPPPITGHVSLTSGVNYCGPIIVNSGVVLTSTNNSFTTKTTGATTSITVNTGGQLTFNSGSNCNCSLTVAGGTVTFGSGTYTLNGIDVTGGQLTSNSGGTYNINGGITVSSGTVTLGSGTYTLNGSTTTACGASEVGICVDGGTATATVTVNPGTYTLYGGIYVSGASSTFTSNSGTYTMTLTPPTAGTIAATNVSNGGTLTFGSGTYTMTELINSAQVTLNAGGTSPGTYIFNSDTTTTPMLSLTDGTLTGNTGTGGVTLVFTSSSGKYDATAMTVTASTINLTAPTTGPTTGIVLFGNNSTSGSNAMPLGTNFNFDVDSTLKVSGAVYLPRGALQFAAFDFNNSEHCTQIIADTIKVIGIAYFADQCTAFGTSVDQLLRTQAGGMNSDVRA